MGLVGDRVVLPRVEAKTWRGTPITIGGCRDEYYIDEFKPGERDGFRPDSPRDTYVVTPCHIKESEWTESCSFIIDADELEQALMIDEDDTQPLSISIDQKMDFSTYNQILFPNMFSNN